VQSNLSVGGSQACTGSSPGLIGRFTIQEGLRRLLSGSGCDFRRIGADAVRVVPAAPSPPAAPARTVRLAAPKPLEIAAPQAVSVNEVVVVSTRRPAILDQVPYAISAIDRRELAIAGANDISDVTAQLAGVSTTNLGPGRDKILIRGLSDGAFTGRTQSTVGIYLDDVPITYNAPDPDLRLADVAAIEILRGPQGTLYGGGSMSGIYRIVPQKPVLGEQAESFRIGGALTQGGAGSHEAQGMVNLPIGEQAAVRAVLYEDVLGGYIDDVNLHLANIDETMRTGGRAAFGAALPSDWELTAGFAAQSIRSNDTQYISPSLGRLHRANQVREASHNDFSEGTVNLRRNGGWGGFSATTSVVNRDLASRSDASNALPLFGFSTSKAASYDEPINQQSITEDAVLNSPSVGRLQWLVGVFGSLTRETTDAVVRADPNAPVLAQALYIEHRTDHMSEAAVYGESSYALTPRLTATAGVRVFATGVGTRSDVEAPQTNQSRLFAGSSSGQGASPKLALNYAWAEDQMVYASISEGHRAGGFNTGGVIGTTFVAQPTARGVQQRFGADELWNYEVGAKLTALGGDLKLRTAVFYNVWTNIQTDQFMISGLSYTANAGDGRNIGWESEILYHPGPQLTLEANALIDRPILTRANPGFIAGVNLPGVPDVSVGGRASYARPVIGGLTLRLGADASYIGRSHLTFDPTIATSMGGYVLARLTAQLEGRDWRLAAFLSNPTNAAGDTFSYGNPFNFQLVREATPQRPRTFRMQLSMDF
jgi:iron complex outermembrane receptor protein